MHHKTYFIKKGNHRSGIFFAPKFIYHGLDVVEFGLSKECYFKPTDVDDLDVNKLFGYSFGLHHKNSIRLGWRPSKEENKIEILAYYYNKGVRGMTSICEVEAVMHHTSTIGCDFRNNTITVSVIKKDDTKTTVKIPFAFPQFKIGYYLFPYFGGNKVAPCDMCFYLNVNS